MKEPLVTKSCPDPKSCPEPKQKVTNKVMGCAAADVGNANLFTAGSPTGAIHPNGTPFMEIRNVSKGQYNHYSGRNGVNAWTRKLRRRGGVELQERNNDLTQNTTKTSHFSRMIPAVAAKRRQWLPLYHVWNNREFQKRKVAARIQEKRTIDKLLHWITWEGSKLLGVGDCSRTTGIPGTTPGGPNKRILQQGVKKGYRIYLVDEQYTSKRSCCCFTEGEAVDLRPVKAIIQLKNGVQGPRQRKVRELNYYNIIILHFRSTRRFMDCAFAQNATRHGIAMCRRPSTYSTYSYVRSTGGSGRSGSLKIPQ